MSKCGEKLTVLVARRHSHFWRTDTELVAHVIELSLKAIVTLPFKMVQ